MEFKGKLWISDESVFPVRGHTIFSYIVQINDESAGVQNTVKDVDCRLQTSACGRIRLGKDMQLSEILSLRLKQIVKTKLITGDYNFLYLL